MNQKQQPFKIRMVLAFRLKDDFQLKKLTCKAFLFIIQQIIFSKIPLLSLFSQRFMIISLLMGKWKLIQYQYRKYMQAKSKGAAQNNLEQAKQSQSWELYQGNTQLGKKINAMLNGTTYTVISTIVMCFSLFGDDIKQLAFPQSSDLGFTITTLICMIFYAIEMVIFSLVQKDYFLKYYFWLDLVSTLTMSLDLIWVSQFLTGGGRNAANISQITKASRATRLGTKTVRLIRLIRMIKIIKQLKQVSKELAKTQHQMIPKKSSQRLSSIHSKIASQKLIERMNSFRHVQRAPSKRWSVLKDLGCMGLPNIQMQVRPPVMSIDCLPYACRDQVIDRQSMSSKTNKSKTLKKIEEQDENPNAGLPSFHDNNKRDAVIQEYVNKPSKDSMEQKLTRSKRTKHEIQKKEENEIGVNPSDPEIQIPPESKVGAKVQQQIQKNIILMIILILVSIPVLDGSTWFTPLTVYDKGCLDLVYFANTNPASYQAIANAYIEYATGSFLNPLLYFSINSGSIIDNFPDYYQAYSGTFTDILNNYRSDDISIISGNGYTFGFSIAWYNKLGAAINIARTLFICILLITTTIVFSNDLEKAAIAPLEQMMETVRKMAINPLNAIKQIQEKKLCLQKIQQEQQNLIQNTEPQILQNTIVKIGSLLAVGFGEAGTQIICRVIQDPTIIDVMIPGQKIMAVFGFCDIRNFTDATQVLEADVMVFVNQIAAICHKSVYEHLGSPNKNIGDAFLLVWKFAQEDLKITETEDATNIQLIRSTNVSNRADLSVLALIKMVADLTRSECLQKYKTNKGLQQRIPNYAGVKMGFGLHAGWAIEGPIGSEYKIDASYLGPDVHMSSRLQAATKGYGTGMLITDSLYNIMTQNKNRLRLIDRVMPEGDNKVTLLYTVDMQPKHLLDELGLTKEKHFNEKEKKYMKIYQNNNRKKLNLDLNAEGMTNALWNDEQIKILQELYTQKFYEEWSAGFKCYVNGEWERALQHLTLTCSYAPGGYDGPSESLIKFIEDHNGHAPADWKGYRSFD